MNTPSPTAPITREQCIEWLAAHAFTEGRMPSLQVAALLNRDVFPAILAHLRAPLAPAPASGDSSSRAGEAQRDSEREANERRYLWLRAGGPGTGLYVANSAAEWRRVCGENLDEQIDEALEDAAISAAQGKCK